MANSYDALGLIPLRDDAIRVLRQSFPNSVYLSGKSLPTQAKAWWQLW
jgi:outer membrane protein assembly factor BamD